MYINDSKANIDAKNYKQINDRYTFFDETCK